jgi:3-oxoacyl-[acyl-carrier-protein] synthase-3
MIFNNVALAGISYYVPEESLTSEAIENRLAPIYDKLKLPYGRLELMTGIKARRHWAPGTAPSSLATKAANNFLAAHNWNKDDIEMLVHASVCRDFLEPSTASVVHANLGLSEHCEIFDLSNACLGVMSSIKQAATMIEHGIIKRALIVSGENGGPLLEKTISELLKLNEEGKLTRKNIKKYIANLTIGSAAVAVGICHKDLAPDAPKVLGGSVMTDSTANELCRGDGNPDSLMMETDSEALLAHGIELAAKNWSKCCHKLGWKTSDVNWSFGHQVGVAHENLTMKAMGLHEKNTFRTYDHFGNTGSAALPLTLAQAAEQNLMQKGDRVALLGIGSGLTSLMVGLQW